MSFIADFHIHSKYSRATSKDMDIENISKWARLKGINLVGTGDFTHPAWLRELKEKLKETEYGIYTYNNIYFMLTAEVNNIYFKAGKTRKVHNIIFAPSFKIAEEINKALGQYGSLFSDGRPILSLPCDEMLRRFNSISRDIFVVPAHIWTPHFSVFGSNSGFDAIEDCFEEQTERVYALETGLSSDPAMNWRWSKLDRFSLVSNSDAHSPAKLGREANIFKEKFGYQELINILRTKDRTRFLFTVEFFPEEGKYHWDGHRKCDIRLSPQESRNARYRCPKCGAKVTVGVMNRVEKLADREKGFVLGSAPSFRKLVPLAEIVASAMDKGVGTLSVQKEYNTLLHNFGSEFNILLDVPEERIQKECPEKIARGILNVRRGNVEIAPGYDGEYGTVNVFGESKERKEKQQEFF